MKRVIVTLVLAACLTEPASSQTTRWGDPNFVRETDWRSGMPVVLTVTSQDVGYEFDGTPLQVPFTISGTQANVWLAVYTKGADPQYGATPLVSA